MTLSFWKGLKAWISGLPVKPVFYLAGWVPMLAFVVRISGAADVVEMNVNTVTELDNAIS